MFSLHSKINVAQRRTKAEQRRDAQVEKTDGGMRNMGIFNFNLLFLAHIA